MAIAGGLRGAPVELAPCQTIDLPYIADAEIVLEAEILPTGWTWPEGRFGEFTRLMGGLHWNPLVRIKAISMRKDAIYYNLHMPWENTWLAAPTRYAAIRQALKTAGVQVKDINVTLGGCAFWHAVISIKKQPGEAKNALLAALSVMDLKHVVVVDDDIDVFDPTEVEWAIATRVQGDKDVMIVSNARAKPLDPSLPQGYGVVPTGAKVGIDATIPEGIPREYYERITYAYADRAKIEDYVDGKADEAASPATSSRSLIWPRGSWRRSPRRRSTTPTSRNARPTTSAPSRARSGTCTRASSFGRTRAGACACAARSSRPSRRGADRVRRAGRPGLRVASRPSQHYGVLRLLSTGLISSTNRSRSTMVKVPGFRPAIPVASPSSCTGRSPGRLGQAPRILPQGWSSPPVRAVRRRCAPPLPLECNTREAFSRAARVASRPVPRCCRRFARVRARSGSPSSWRPPAHKAA